ncbi:MAG: zinc dependent phospholipase C family protein [bacterium]
MPATYAHLRFGREVFLLLPDQIQSVILEEPSLYAIGLHGPDIFFYHMPFMSNPVSRLGSTLHHKPGRFFFERAGLILKDRGERREDLAYLWGYLCHFTLDVYCHAYINQRVAETGASHTAIESDFDRDLLLKDGYEPTARDLTAHIHPRRDYARVIAAYHPETKAGTVYRSLKDFVFYNDLLLAPDPVKRSLLKTAFGVFDPRGKLFEHMIMEEADPRCGETRTVLFEKYNAAVPAAADLIGRFSDMAGGNCGWDDLFDFTFDSIKI